MWDQYYISSISKRIPRFKIPAEQNWKSKLETQNRNQRKRKRIEIGKNRGFTYLDRSPPNQPTLRGLVTGPICHTASAREKIRSLLLLPLSRRHDADEATSRPSSMTTAGRSWLPRLRLDPLQANWQLQRSDSHPVPVHPSRTHPSRHRRRGDHPDLSLTYKTTRRTTVETLTLHRHLVLSHSLCFLKSTEASSPEFIQ
jgi:hypothetical protein